jgi:hypothetical protein
MIGSGERALHGPAHEGGTGGKQDAFQHEQDSDADEEVDERYGPHRIAASRFALFVWAIALAN